MKWIDKLAVASQAHVNAYGAQYNAFCLFFLVNYVCLPNHWAMVGPYPHAGLWTLRLLACAFTLILFFRNYWPQRLQKYLPLYWFFVLFYCLSFRTVFTVMYSQYTTTFKYFGVMGLIGLAILVDRKVFLILLLSGLVSGIPFFYLTCGSSFELPTTSTLFFAAYGYFSCIFLKLVFSRNNEMAFQKRLSDLRLWAGSIAHEVRRHVVTMARSLEGLKTQIGILTETHNFACQNGYDGVKISAEQLDRLQAVVGQFSTVANQALMTIELLLAEAQNQSSRGEQFSVAQCVQESIQDFPFAPQERELLQINVGADCMLTGKSKIFSLLLVNLIANALEAVHAAQKGHVEIYTTQMKSHFDLCIKDTGVGIAQQNLSHIFDDFFTTKSSGTGIGLAISKRIVELHGGEIFCHSIEGQFSEFICRFRRQS